MHNESRVLWGYSAPPAILPRSPQFCQNGKLSVYLQWENRKVGWVGDNSHVVFGKRFSGENASVRRWTVVTQQLALLLLKFGTKSSHIFTHCPQNVTVVCGIECLTCHTNYLWTIPLKMMRILLSLLFNSLVIFCLSWTGHVIQTHVNSSSFLNRKLV
jgi:hypothetical protein